MKKAHSLAQLPENYRKVLLAKKSELSSSLRTKLDTLTGPAGAAPEDLAPVFYDQFIATRINRLDYLQLKLIDAALARIDGKEFGVCIDCQEEISSSRLAAIPWALRCINCQELFGCDSDSSFAEGTAQLEEVSV